MAGAARVHRSRPFTALWYTSLPTHGYGTPVAFQRYSNVHLGVHPCGVHPHRRASNLPFHKANHLHKCFKLLGVSEDCTLPEAKEAYLKLAKKYHPDGNSGSASSSMFGELTEAYETVCVHLEKEEASCVLVPDDNNGDEGGGIDVKHTAPQHRQYLAFEGIGTGTLVQREKQYQAYRAFRAANLATDHKIERLAYQDAHAALVVKDKKAAQKIKTTNTLDRMVEDLVQKSMANGEFDNLPGSGKPLPSRTHYCPYIDISQHNLNQVLANNGYAPDWIRMEREIRLGLHDIKDRLLKERLKLGPEPLNTYNEKKWKGLIDDFGEDVASLNKQINHLNLIVPIIRLQMVHYKVDRELEKVMAEYQQVKPAEPECSAEEPSGTMGSGRLFQLFEKLGEKIASRIMQS